jgi:hypothetical protein
VESHPPVRNAGPEGFPQKRERAKVDLSDLVFSLVLNAVLAFLCVFVLHARKFVFCKNSFFTLPTPMAER